MCQSGSQESVHQESMDCFKILREYLGNHEFCPQIAWGGLSFPCFVSHHPILGNTINDHLMESPGASGAVAAIDHVPQNWAANGCHVNSNPCQRYIGIVFIYIYVLIIVYGVFITYYMYLWSTYGLFLVYLTGVWSWYKNNPVVYPTHCNDWEPSPRWQPQVATSVARRGFR